MLGSLISGGLGILGSIFGGNSAEKAAAENARLANQYMDRGLGYIDQGQNKATGYLQQAGDLWKPFAQAGQGHATNALGMYSNALGLGGADGTAAAQNAFQAGPGYQFAMDQGLQALERRAAAQGRLQSGQTGIDTMNFAQGLANQEYGNWMNNLQGLGNTGAQMWQTGLAGRGGALSDLASLNMQGAGMRNQVLGGGMSALMGANNQRAEGQQNMMGGIFKGLGTMAGGLGGLGGGFGGYL